MAWAKFLAAVGRYRDLVTEHAGLIVEDFQRAGVLRLGRRALVAAAHQDREPVIRRDTDLMRVNARIDRAGLRYLLAGREILVDSIDSHRTWVVERHRFQASPIVIRRWHHRRLEDVSVTSRLEFDRKLAHG